MTAALLDGSAQAITAAIRTGAASAREIVKTTLSAHRGSQWRARRLHRRDRDARARQSRRHRRGRARGASLGPLAGAPFAVKNLFDIEGLPTRAGSKINRDRAPAMADATLVARLEAAGALLVGALNMGEYAYDFTGENAHDGPSRNPHDLGHMTGGSSGGSAAAVAGGLVPIALGIRHQRLDSRAVLLVRIVWPEADLWPAVARRRVPVRRQSRSCGTARAIRRRSRALPTTPCSAGTTRTRRRPTSPQRR